MKLIKKILLIVLVVTLNTIIISKTIFAANQETTSTEEITIQNNQVKEWLIEGKEEKFMRFSYNVKTKSQIETYKVSLEKIDNELPEGIKTADSLRVEQKEFKANREFLVIIPITSLKESGSFKINVEATNIQGETLKNSYIQSYPKNDTKIRIIKENILTREKIQGVEFEVLNEKKEILYQNLKTNELGMIEITALKPGKYYIRETNTIENYILNDELIEVDVGYYGQVVDVKVNGQKIETSEPKEEVEPTPGLEQEDPNEKVEQIPDLEQEEKIESNTDIENNNNKTSITKKEGIKEENQINNSTVKKLPITGM